MKPFIIDRNSWHYRLVHTFNSVHDLDNMCQYLRRVILSAIIGLGITILASLLIGICSWMIFIEPLIWLGNVIWHLGSSTYHVSELTQALWWLVALFVVVGLCVAGFNWLKEWSINRKYNGITPEVPEPGFIVTAYRSTIGKFCLKVKVV